MIKTYNIIDSIPTNLSKKDDNSDKEKNNNKIKNENNENNDENNDENINEEKDDEEENNENKINSGEKCTYDYINKNNLDEKYLTEIKKKSNDFIKNDLKKSICNYKNKKATLNCAIKSPFYTYKGDYTNNNNKCKLYNCPEKFEKKGNKCEMDINNLNNDLIWKTEIKNVCEEKWYDWFVIPNYHLGNSIKKFNKPYPDENKEHKDNMIECYDSCDNGLLPYITDKSDESNNNNKICVKKNIKDYGLYGDTPDYCPINGIHLLGQVDFKTINDDENFLKESYLKIREKPNNKDIENEQLELNKILINSNKEIKEKANKYIKYLYDNKHKNYLNDRYYTKHEIQKCNELLTDDNIKQAYLKCIKIKEDKNYIKNKILPYYYDNIDNNENNELILKHIETLNWSCDNCFKKDGLFYNDIKDIANRKENIIKPIDNIKEKNINKNNLERINKTFEFSYNNIYNYIYDIFLGNVENSKYSNKYLNYIFILFYILIFLILFICFYLILFKLTRPIYNNFTYTFSKIFLYLSDKYNNIIFQYQSEVQTVISDMIYNLNKKINI